MGEMIDDGAYLRFPHLHSDLLCFVNGRIVAYGPPDETFTPATLHATFGGELMIVDAGDHAHVHGGGHHDVHEPPHEH